MEEIIKAIEESLEDENADVEKYTKLANMCSEHNHMGCAQMLHDIASEEMTHAKHLHEMLKELSDE